MRVAGPLWSAVLYALQRRSRWWGRGVQDAGVRHRGQQQPAGHKPSATHRATSLGSKHEPPQLPRIPRLRPPAPSPSSVSAASRPPAAARASEDVLSAAGLRWSAWGVPFALTAPARSPGSDPPPATHTRHFQQAVVPHPDASPPTPHVAMAPGSDSKLGAVGAPASPAPARPASGQAPLWWRLTPGCRLCRGQGRVRVADAAWVAPPALTVL